MMLDISCKATSALGNADVDYHVVLDGISVFTMMLASGVARLQHFSVGSIVRSLHSHVHVRPSLSDHSGECTYVDKTILGTMRAWQQDAQAHVALPWTPGNITNVGECRCFCNGEVARCETSSQKTLKRGNHRRQSPLLHAFYLPSRAQANLVQDVKGVISNKVEDFVRNQFGETYVFNA
eukprot:3189339-Amphidinium_carterae.1